MQWQGCKEDLEVMGAWAHYQAGTSDVLQQDTAPLAHACRGVLLPGARQPHQDALRWLWKRFLPHGRSPNGASASALPRAAGQRLSC